MTDIRFYRANEKPYGVFSNLFRRDMVFEGHVFPTAEHAYQYGKARKPAVRDWMMLAPSPSLLAMVAHGLYSWDIAPGWSTGRFDRMGRVMLAKYEQHADLREILIGTGAARLVEYTKTNNPTNRRWGEVEGVGGENWCGRLLQVTRHKMGGSP